MGSAFWLVRRGERAFWYHVWPRRIAHSPIADLPIVPQTSERSVCWSALVDGERTDGSGQLAHDGRVGLVRPRSVPPEPGHLGIESGVRWQPWCHAAFTNSVRALVAHAGDRAAGRLPAGAAAFAAANSR